MRNLVRVSVSWNAALLLACAFWLCTALPAAAQDADWRIGLATVKITPEKPIEMAGYANRIETHTGVTLDIYAKAMAFEDQDGGKGLLITADILGFPREVADKLCAGITERTGLPREAILLNASHTHAGPVMTSRISVDTSEETWARVREYTAVFHEKVLGAAVAALDDMQPATISWGRGVAKFVMNRREFTERGIILGSNPLGLADRTVPVLRVIGADEKLRAVLFGAACHCTTQGGQNLSIDGEYAGYAQQHLEEAYPGAQAMFMTGCGGDANPYPRGTLELARQHGAELGGEVARVLDTDLAPVRGPLRTAYATIDLPLMHFEGPQDLERDPAKSYHSWFVQTAKKFFEEGRKLAEVYNAPFAVWQFGEDLTLVGFSGETLVDYAKFTERDLGPLKLWVSGYCNDVYGYLPSACVLAEGGYETRGLYVDAGIFAPEVEDVVMDTIKRLAKEVGRPGME